MSERIRQSLTSILSEVSIIHAELDKVDPIEPPKVEDGLILRKTLVEEWQSTMAQPVRKLDTHISGGYSRIQLAMTIEVGKWHPQLPDGIHGLFWLFEGDWDRTFGYAICRGPKRNRISFLTKRGWGKGEAGQGRIAWRFERGQTVGLTAVFVAGEALLILNNSDSIVVFSGDLTQEPFG
ncbi:MAG: hypothetical protein AAF690_15990, partial [Acidobacteriota bacterium]